MNTAQQTIPRFRSCLFFVHESATYLLSVDELHVGQKVARNWATLLPAWLPVLLILSWKHLNVYRVVHPNFGD